VAFSDRPALEGGSSIITRREFIAMTSGAAGGALSCWQSAAARTTPAWSRNATAISASRAVLARLIPDRIGECDLQYIPPENGCEVYVVSAARGRLQIKGSSGVALCRGAYAYFRETGIGMVGWGGSNLQLPARLPDLDERHVACPYKFIQYYNPCVFGYTAAFWNWNRWERELDWMALHGITMPLAMEGQEAIWQRVWMGFGITQSELDRYFTGPAYLPWHRLGNLAYFEGPLPQGWIDQKRVLQRKILDRMRELGMSPVVPAFSGYVPEAFKGVYPQARIFTELWLSEMPRQSKTLILDLEQLISTRKLVRDLFTNTSRNTGMLNTTWPTRSMS
jgi:alpha-N-acetylglucosaminidase